VRGEAKGVRNSISGSWDLIPTFLEAMNIAGVDRLAADPQLPSFNSSIFTRVTLRNPSPLMRMTTPVISMVSWAFCSGVNTFSIVWTFMSGMAVGGFAVGEWAAATATRASSQVLGRNPFQGLIDPLFQRRRGATAFPAVLRAAAAGRDYPNLLFLWTEQQRADTLACYGNPRVQALHLNFVA
jgi:hypothetical protein